jgi:hypothetical protein
LSHQVINGASVFPLKLVVGQNVPLDTHTHTHTHKLSSILDLNCCMKVCMEMFPDVIIYCFLPADSWATRAFTFCMLVIQKTRLHTEDSSEPCS